MVVTATVEAAQPAQGNLRPLEPGRDMGVIADLIAEAFADELDARGKAALREMRLMALFRPFVWWMAQADPSFRDTFNGFVWEEPAAKGRGQQVVGNVSLNRAPGSRSRWIICNVVVRETYRGQGIARRLTERAIAEARQLGAGGVVLQVYRDNLPASNLYTSLSFQEVAAETEFRLASVGPVAFLDAPGYSLRTWQPADGQAAYELAVKTIAEPRRWLRPLRADQYKPDWLSRLGQNLGAWLSRQRVYRLVALWEEQVVALLTVTAAHGQDTHRLDLVVHPAHTGQLAVALVSRALHLLAAVPSRPVTVTAEPGNSALVKVLHEYGFVERRTLLTLYKNLDRRNGHGG